MINFFLSNGIQMPKTRTKINYSQSGGAEDDGLTTDEIAEIKLFINEFSEDKRSDTITKLASLINKLDQEDVDDAEELISSESKELFDLYKKMTGRKMDMLSKEQLKNRITQLEEKSSHLQTELHQTRDHLKRQTLLRKIDKISCSIQILALMQNYTYSSYYNAALKAQRPFQPMPQMNVLTGQFQDDYPPF